MQKILTALFLFSSLTFFAQQATIRITVTQIGVTQNCDRDNLPFNITGDSDWVWEFIANTGGGACPSLTNNNPVLLGDFNYENVNGNNGPFSRNVNQTFFDRQFVCATCLPNAINIIWRGYENDGPLDFADPVTRIGIDGNTGNQNVSLTVPAIGGTNTQTFSATSNSNCSQTHSITFRIDVLPLSIQLMEDLICSAPTVPVDGVTRDFGFCGNYSLEPNEPRAMSMQAHGSAWVAFTAPASGNLDISTDVGNTDFGTEVIIYHAADGNGCTSGNSCTGQPIKGKMDYLSYVDEADLGGFLNLEGEADIAFTACNPIPLIESNRLIAGQTYYIQITSDDNNQKGFVSLNLSAGGGSPAEAHDIPCGAQNVNLTTTNTNFSLGVGCSTNRETGGFRSGTAAGQYHAYQYDHANPNPIIGNNGSVDESVWMRFIAPNSGRLLFSADVPGFLETENATLWGYDTRFGPGRPGDFSCANLSVMASASGSYDVIDGATPALIDRRCLEPGYTYFGMIDPASASIASSANGTIIDPSANDPANNPPGNDILCLMLNNPAQYEVPVVCEQCQAIAVPGSNVNACIERLAGEPVSDPLAANRADQTTWHFFTVPPSGVVEIRFRSFTINRLRYALYPLLNGTNCYGGLGNATFAQNGLCTGLALLPLHRGFVDRFAPRTVDTLCCLVPGTKYAIQIDGGSPNDVGQYLIDGIREIEVYAGDAAYTTQLGDDIRYNSNDTAFICYNQSIMPYVMRNALGVSTAHLPTCLDTGFVIHSAPTPSIPNPIANVGFTYIDSTRANPSVFLNDGNGSGTFGNPLFNTVYYVSPMADERNTWGDLTCPSASMENAAPFVFLGPILTSQSFNTNTCDFTFSASGGLPAFNSSLFSYEVLDGANVVFSGTFANGVNVTHQALSPVIYTVNITDDAGCVITLSIDATGCLNPCIINRVVITPSPIDSTVYTCYPDGSADVRLFLNFGDPVTNGTDYNVNISGSSAAGQNGSRNVPFAGTPTQVVFRVNDGDAWQIIAGDVNNCPDTANGIFNWNLTNCPNACQTVPISLSPDPADSSVYDCMPGGYAMVTVGFIGGRPQIDQSDYLITVSGSTVIGSNVTAQVVASSVGGSGTYSFTVRDNDAWQVVVVDQWGCTDTLSGVFDFDTTDCSNMCQIQPVIVQPDPLDSTIYECYPDGSAIVTLILGGGVPENWGGSFRVTVSGSTAGGNVVDSLVYVTRGTVGRFRFRVANGDTWALVAVDSFGCTDLATDTYNAANCPNICIIEPISLANISYNCNADGTAVVSITVSGGRPHFDGSNYSVQIAGSTVAGQSGIRVVPGLRGDSVTFNFIVDDGDVWNVRVSDNSGCLGTANGTFDFGSADCPNFCQLLPLSILPSPIDSSVYNCFPNQTATVTVVLRGGRPSYDGSNYTLRVYGSSVGGNAIDTLIPGAIGGAVPFTFLVADGDIWQVLIHDDEQCTIQTGGVFQFNLSNCDNICTDPNYTSIQINRGSNDISYNCDGQGNATLAISLSGGLPSMDSGLTNYILTVNLNGTPTRTSVPIDNNGVGNFILNLEDGDTWFANATDTLGCSSDNLGGLGTTFHTVEAIAIPSRTDALLIGETLTLDGSQSQGNNLTHAWTPITNLDNPNGAVTNAMPLITTRYVLRVEDDFDCADTDTVRVEVGPCVPGVSAFTPNDDATNDFWEIPCLMLYDNETRVYNRWGEQVFFEANYRGTWDGTSNGSDLPDATYYYVIDVFYPNGTKDVYKGTVTILR